MRIVLALLCLLLAACASDSAPVATAAPAAGGPYWITFNDRVGLTPDEREQITDHLDAGLAGARAMLGAAGAKELRITVTSFRRIDETARAAEGMVAGTDHIQSVVQVVDPASRQVLSEQRVLTKARRAIGTDAMLGDHGDDIVEAVTGR